MDKYIEQKIAKLKKSLYKNIQKSSKKDVIKDVLDTNNIAEISPDDVAPAKTSIVKKSKDEECDCEKKDDCKCDEAPIEESGIHKSEKAIREIMGNFKVISEAYIKKYELNDTYDINQKKQAERKKADKEGKTRMVSDVESHKLKTKASENKDNEKKQAKWDKESKVFQDHQKKISGQDNQDMGDEKMAASEKTEDCK